MDPWSVRLQVEDCSILRGRSDGTVRHRAYLPVISPNQPPSYCGAGLLEVADALGVGPGEAEKEMPILREWHSPDGLLRTVLVGPVSFEDMNEHLDQVAQANAFPRAELIDARAVESPPPSLAELRRLAARARDLMGRVPPGPRALVVETAVGQLVAELFSIFMSGPMRVSVFRSEATARRWLKSDGEGNGNTHESAPDPIG